MVNIKASGVKMTKPLMVIIAVIGWIAAVVLLLPFVSAWFDMEPILGIRSGQSPALGAANGLFFAIGAFFITLRLVSKRSSP